MARGRGRPRKYPPKTPSKETNTTTTVEDDTVAVPSSPSASSSSRVDVSPPPVQSKDQTEEDEDPHIPGTTGGKSDKDVNWNESFFFIFGYYERTETSTLVICRMCSKEKAKKGQELKIVVPYENDQPHGVIRRTGLTSARMDSHIKSSHFSFYSKMLENKKYALERKDAFRKQKPSSDDKTQTRLFKAENNQMSCTYSSATKKMSADFQIKFDAAQAQFCADQHCSFALACGKPMRQFLSVFTTWPGKIPPFKIKCAMTVSRHVGKKANIVRSKLQQIIEADLESMVSASFTSDIWTSRNSDSYISLTLSYITANWKLLNMVLFVSHIEFKHDKINISIELSDMIQKMKLDGEKPRKYIAADTARNMKAGIKRVPNSEGVDCCNHKLQLAVTDSWNDKNISKSNTSDVINKAKKVAVKCKRSEQYNLELKRACLKTKTPFKKLYVPGLTRWNSTFLNLKSVLHAQKALNWLAVNRTERDWSAFIFSGNDWALIAAICASLEQVLLATKAFEKEKAPTSNLVVYQLFSLQSFLRSYSSNVDNDRFVFVKLKKVTEPSNNSFHLVMAGSTRRFSVAILRPGFHPMVQKWNCMQLPIMWTLHAGNVDEI